MGLEGNCRFVDEEGTFVLEDAQDYSHLYFPIAGEAGLKSALTPTLGGDAKLNQNAFLLEPVSTENLHNNKSSRNFWCLVEQLGAWSATGASAEEQAKRFTDGRDKSQVTAGFMWHRLTRASKKYQLQSEITSYVLNDCNVEVMQVKITNIGAQEIRFTPCAAIPIYGRSADNIRDHRHVTSLLHRTEVTTYGVEVTPTLSFDERGHQVNHMTYFVYGADESGKAPVEFYPVAEDYIGEGGSFEHPAAVIRGVSGVKAGASFAGKESLGGLKFADKVLKPEESAVYTIFIGAAEKLPDAQALAERFSTEEKRTKEFEEIKGYWQDKVNVSYQSGDKGFDGFLRWVSFQPILRRIYGCSFLPDHDYGKGGRGWRDLWQDCLALLIMNPGGVRKMLVDNFAGVRMDGTNATIIGTGQGEFIADRNNITRVWMDHGVWPFMTTKLYIDQTGDIEILGQQDAYFKDKQICRGTKMDEEWNEEYGCWQKTEAGVRYEGSVLEHLLVQHLTAFYEVGEHNQIRLRGADWNDALDMAPERGESVAFTNAYAGNFMELAELVEAYGEKTGSGTVQLAEELLYLLESDVCAQEGGGAAQGGDADDTAQDAGGGLPGADSAQYGSTAYRLAVLERYVNACTHTISGRQVPVSLKALAADLRHKAEALMENIRHNEWVEDGSGNGWYNGYYDNHGRKVEGASEDGVRMMLTSQVFAVMSGTADEEQTKAITRSADKYLYREEIGGYRLNTDFHELKTDLGRMFGFAYGDKENGAVFSHMAVMYANALYKRGFVQAGYKALKALEEQASDFEKGHIYPGIPEYFNAQGKGMYHYLTGAASWYMLTVITQMYGVRGELGSLTLEPKLLAKQFDQEGKAAVKLDFAGIPLQVIYRNPTAKEYGAYRIGEICCDKEIMDGAETREDGRCASIPARNLRLLDKEKRHVLEVTLV